MPKRGENIYKRKDGRWEGRYSVGFRENGKRRYRSVYGSSYQAVREKLIRLKSTGTPPKMPQSKTVSELLNEWMQSARQNAKASTIANYDMKLRKHLLPALGGLKCNSVSGRLVNSFMEQKRQEGLSAKYIADIVTVLKSAFKYAARVYSVQNPLQYVVLPKAERTEKPLLNAQQQETLQTYLQSNPSATATGILCSMNLGLRIGEVCGLKFSDIDLQNHTLTVRRTVQRINDSESHHTRLIVGSPKSRSSKRVIPIPAFLVDILQKQTIQPDAYLLSGTEQPVEPRTMQYRFQSVLKKAGLPSMNFHSLRHVFATNCLQAGFDVKTLSEILGHSSPETTLNRYVHSSMERKRQCMRLLEKKAYLPSDDPSANSGNAA